MKIRVGGLLVAAALVVMPTVAGAASNAPDSARGGGKVMFGSDSTLTTLSFTARNIDSSSDAASGQIQFNDHSGTKWHGTISCIRVNGDDKNGAAKMGGTITKGDGSGSHFQLYVEDNGEGSSATESDMAAFTGDDDDSCDFDTPGSTSELAHGNYQVHDGPGGMGWQESSSASSLKLANLTRLAALNR